MPRPRPPSGWPWRPWAPPRPGRPRRGRAGRSCGRCRTVALPGGGTAVFGHQRFLTAYYGTAGTGVLGVLGETDPDTAYDRIFSAAKRFQRPGERVLPVFELIVTVADGIPGPDGDYSHDIAHSRVQPYIDAAHRHGALLLLDLQPGPQRLPDRGQALAVGAGGPLRGARARPRVADGTRPGARPGRRPRPGRRRSTGPRAWLAGLTGRRRLPEKLFLVHQFRSSMVPGHRPGAPPRGLAMVQHVDGFGSPAQKLATYAAVARPRQFTMGFKLFYDEDRPRMTAAGGAEDPARGAVRELPVGDRARDR